MAGVVFGHTPAPPVQMPAQPPLSTNQPSAGDTTRPISVITGGSEGIGLAIARVLAGRGHQLLLIGRTQEKLDEAARSLRAEHGHGIEVFTLALDLAQGDIIQRVDAKVGELGAHVGLLVNNAAAGYCGSFADAAPEDLDRLLALNLVTPTRLLRHVLAGMCRRGRGGIINIASLGGYVPGPYQATYYASKAYLISLSEALSAEAKPFGVRVTVVVPGPVDTAFHSNMNAESALYRRLVPSSSAAGVAKWSVLGYELGLRVVVPGIFNLIGAGALRLLPHFLLVPVMAWLLAPRRPTQEGTRT